MKWKLCILFSILLLTGCSYVEVDDDTSRNSAEKSDAKEEPNKLEQFVKDLNIFDWSDRKTLDAEEVYYLALGDSLTRGVGDEADNYGFTGLLKEEMEKSPNVLSVELDNRGKNGRRSDQLLGLLKDGHYDEQLKKASVITITLGGNDVMKVVKNDLFNLKPKMFEKALPGFVERYTEIIDIIRAQTDAPIVLVGFYNPFSIITDEITPFETIIHDWNNEVKAIAEQTDNACFVSVEDLFLSNEDMVYHTDFFHPNAAGYKRMATRILETIPTCNLEELTSLFPQDEG